jgi:hypothetical protein
MTTWTESPVRTDAIADIVAMQTCGQFNIEYDFTDTEYLHSLQLRGKLTSYISPAWFAASKESSIWSRVDRHGDFGEGIMGSEFMGGTKWTIVAKDS